MPAKKSTQSDEKHIEFHNSILDGLQSLQQISLTLAGIESKLEGIDTRLKTLRDICADYTGFHRPP